MSSAAQTAVRDALARFAARSSILGPHARVVVAYSGGQDSTCLLYAVAHARRARPSFVAAVHVDHALRPESAAQADELRGRAIQLGADSAVLSRVDVRAEQAHHRRWSIQQAARTARYQALAACARELRADALLVAHTADDQAETVLLNMLRGTGLEGLSGMAQEEWLDLARYVPEADTPAAGVRLARPLLHVSRDVTGAYCAELQLPVLLDPSNASRAYTRNRVRLDLLPQLRQFNPAASARLSRLADLAGEDSTALRWLVEDAFARLATPFSDASGFAFAQPDWRALPRGVQRRLLRHAIHRLAGSLRDVSAAPIEDALDLLAAEEGVPSRRYDLSRGVQLVVGRASFTVRMASPGGRTISRES